LKFKDLNQSQQGSRAFFFIIIQGETISREETPFVVRLAILLFYLR